MIPFADRKLLQVSWPDVTHAVSDWHDNSSLTDLLSRNAEWMCSSTGWLVHEDDECYVLAGRMTCDGEVVGLVERIPKSIVTRVRTLALTPELPPAAIQPSPGRVTCRE